MQQQRLRKGLSLKAQREEEERQGQKRRAPKVRHKEEEETEGQRHKRRTTRAQQRQEEEEREGRKKRAKKKKLFKEKEAIHQVPSSASLDPSEQPHYVQAVGLQDWHVRMARSGRASVEALTIDTDLDSEAPSHRRASGAVNPLLLRELGEEPGLPLSGSLIIIPPPLPENYPGYELPMERGGQQQQQLGRPDSTSEEEDSSDESLNPYD